MAACPHVPPVRFACPSHTPLTHPSPQSLELLENGCLQAGGGEVGWQVANRPLARVTCCPSGRRIRASIHLRGWRIPELPRRYRAS